MVATAFLMQAHNLTITSINSVRTSFLETRRIGAYFFNFLENLLKDRVKKGFTHKKYIN